MKYKQVARKQRYQITAMLAVGTKQKRIAEVLGLHPSTISREIRRNASGDGSYVPQQADRAAVGRKRGKGRQRIASETLLLVSERLRLDHSPEQISSSLRLAGLGRISHQTIYAMVENDRRSGGRLHERLRRFGKARKRYGRESLRGQAIAGRRAITERPEIADARGRGGDLEIDLIIGKGHERAVMTIVDRQSRYLWMTLLERKSAVEVADACCRRLRKAKRHLHSITSDNGREFVEHRKISQTLGVDYFFADPYSPWQRGTSENTNGLVRQYLPKGSSFRGLTERRLRTIEERLNTRPRKCLGFATPRSQLFKEQKIALTT